MTWVVGAGGLLGSNTVHALRRAGGEVWRLDRPVAWGGNLVHGHLSNATAKFAADVGDRPWQLAWCAGAGVTGTTPTQLGAEVAVFEQFIEGLSEHFSSARLSQGTVFLASSAGGVFAGAAAPPFDERTPVRPISPYGEAKLLMEAYVTRWGARHDVPIAIGRVANLYGPGQNLDKPQGLVSQMIKAQLLRRPMSVYVPLDTVRDYLYAPDCGELVMEFSRRVRAEAVQHGPATCTKILASQHGVTIGTVIGELRRILKKHQLIIYGASGTAKYQSRDLRLRSLVMTDLDRRSLTPLPAGLRSTVDHLIRSLQKHALLPR